MSGIFGIWNQDGRPLHRAELSTLAATLSHRGLDGERLWIQGPVGFGCQLNRITPEASRERQPLVHPTGPVVVFDGRLDNRKELLAELSPSFRVSSNAPDPELILALYMECGNRFPEMLTGDFALGLYVPKRKELLLARDALGVRPLYYTHVKGVFLFASEMKALLTHPHVHPHPDDEFLGKLLLHKLQEIEERTCFEGVWSVPPAHTVTLTSKELRKHRYWDFEVAKNSGPKSFSECVEGFRFHFEQAVRRRLRSMHPVAVSLSGGLDSSSIFCLAESLRRQGSLPSPSTFGTSYTSPESSPSDEEQFLDEIEQRHGSSIKRVPLTPLGFQDDPRETVWQSETPLFANQWNSMGTFLRDTHTHGARVVLTGHWGDQMLFPTGYLIDLFHNLEWGKIRNHLHEYSRWLTDVDPRAIRRNFFLGLLKSHLPKWIGPYWGHIRAAHLRPWLSSSILNRAYQQASEGSTRPKTFGSAHIENLYEEARSGYYVHGLEWNNKVAARAGMDVAFPFLDRDLITFLMTTPGDLQTHHGIPKILLREALHDVLPQPIKQRTWKANFTQLVNAGIQQDLPRIFHYLTLNPMSIKRGYLKENFLHTWFPRLQNQMCHSSCEAAWRLSDVVGLELWLRVFFGEGRKNQTVSQRQLFIN